MNDVKRYIRDHDFGIHSAGDGAEPHDSRCIISVSLEKTEPQILVNGKLRVKLKDALALSPSQARAIAMALLDAAQRVEDRSK